jgi:hypothetical protein
MVRVGVLGVLPVVGLALARPTLNHDRIVSAMTSAELRAG